VVSLRRALDPQPVGVDGEAFLNATVEVLPILRMLQDLDLRLVFLSHESLEDTDVALLGVFEEQVHVTVDRIVNMADSILQPRFVALDLAFIDDLSATWQVLRVSHPLFLILEVLELPLGTLVEFLEVRQIQLRDEVL
jgi:hypothetical protein